MTKPFILSCESTIDMPLAYIKKHGLFVLPYHYTIDDTDYIDDNSDLTEFYRHINSGSMPITSQINEFTYYDYFKELLNKGDVLHIVFGSGMTNSIQNANSAIQQLKKEYPDKNLEVIDSTCSCCGYGLLVDFAVAKVEGGATLEETAEYINSIKHSIHHQFFSTDLKFFKRSGRISGPAASIGNLLGICPIMHLNYDGKIVAYKAVRGKKSAIRYTVSEIDKHISDTENAKCFISHSDCLSDAISLQQEIRNSFPKLGEIKIFDIGPVIASHCGPGTVAVYFLGDERTK